MICCSKEKEARAEAGAGADAGAGGVGEAKRPKVVFDGCRRPLSLFHFLTMPAAVFTFSDF